MASASEASTAIAKAPIRATASALAGDRVGAATVWSHSRRVGPARDRAIRGDKPDAAWFDRKGRTHAARRG